MLGKVEASEFAKEYLGGLVVDSSGLNYFVAREGSQINSTSICSYISNSQIWPILDEMNPLISRRIVTWPSLIGTLLCTSSNSEIGFSVIKSSGLVNVINFLLRALCYIQHLSVHRDRVLLFNSNGNVAISVKGLHSWMPASVPLMLGDALKIISIHKRNLALRQRDFTVRLFRGCHAGTVPPVGFAGC